MSVFLFYYYFLFKGKKLKQWGYLVKRKQSWIIKIAHTYQIVYLLSFFVLKYFKKERIERERACIFVFKYLKIEELTKGNEAKLIR